MSNDIPKLLTVREFAAALRVGLPTARKLIRNGEVPVVCLGERNTRVPADVIVTALKKRSVRK